MRALLLLPILLLCSLLLSASDYPKRSDRLVNDFVGALSAEEYAQLNELLERYERETSIEIAVVMMASTGDVPIADYAFGLGQHWGIGKGGTDNGVLILVTTEQRAIWIATGYGVEAALPDGLIYRIMKREMIDHFIQGDYYSGLKGGIEAIIAVTKDEYDWPGRGKPDASGIWVIILMVVLLMLVWAIKAWQVKRYAELNHLSFWAAWALLNSTRTRHKGTFTDFSRGHGHFGGFGGFSGGGSGGFSGFGGGSFGGGGAGGRW